MLTNPQIIAILTPWNFWHQDIATGKERPKYAGQLFNQKDIKEVSVVTGVRRSGKSTVVLQTLQRLIATGTPATNILYVNFEDPGFAAELNLKFLLQIYDAYIEKFAPTGKIYVALDEAHLVPQWEKFVRGLYDRNVNIKFYVTGSSAYLITREYGTTLTGRYRSNVFWPLSFAEWLDFKGVTLNLRVAADTRLPEARHYFLEYLQFGGFPQVALTVAPEEKTQILKDYYAAIIDKDIIARYGVRNSHQLRAFYMYALSNIGLPISGYQARQNLGIPQPTAGRFLQYAEEVYLFSYARFFSYSLVTQNKHSQKIYCADPGLYNAMAFSFSPNRGRMFENAVLLALRRTGGEIFYWRGKQEVDFVVRRSYEISRLINVCWELNQASRAREISGLQEAMRKFKITIGEIITLDLPEEIKVPEGIIKVKNFFAEPEMVA